MTTKQLVAWKSSAADAAADDADTTASADSILGIAARDHSRSTTAYTGSDSSREADAAESSLGIVYAYGSNGLVEGMVPGHLAVEGCC